MDLNEAIIDFRKQRKQKSDSKETFHSSLSRKRVKRIMDAFNKKSHIFFMLNQSERMDFLLYVLERFLSNSDLIDLEMES